MIRRAVHSLGLASLARLAAAAPASALPELRPPYGPLPPTFWEQHGLAVAGLAALAALAAAGGLWRWRHPRPAAPVPPDVLARRALQALAAQPLDGAALSRISQVLRRYAAAAFGLPPGERTTAELDRDLAARAGLDAGPAAELVALLRACDAAQFAPAGAPPPGGAAQTALDLVTRVAAQRAAAAHQKTEHERRV